jgi:hypothetical protein
MTYADTSTPNFLKIFLYFYTPRVCSKSKKHFTLVLVTASVNIIT